MCDFREKKRDEEVEIEKEEMRIKRAKEQQSSDVMSSSANKRMEQSRISNKLSAQTNESLSAMAAASTDDFSKTFLAVIRGMSEQLSSLRVEITHLHDRIEKLQESSTTQLQVPDICTRIMKRVSKLS